MPIPATSPPSRWWKETPTAIVGTTFAVLGGGAAIFKEANAAQPSHAQVVALSIALLGAVIVGVLGIGRACRKDVKDAKKESPDDLRGCLHVLHSVICAHKGVADPKRGWLRITVHRLDGEFLEQSVDYVGSEDGGAGRRFSMSTGLIGRVARLKEARTFERSRDMPFEEWIRYLVEELGLTQQAAESTRRDRYAFFGVPIQSPGGVEVRAVVYFDASDPTFFDETTVSVAVAGCEGLAAWVDEHYYRG